MGRPPFLGTTIFLALLIPISLPVQDDGKEAAMEEIQALLDDDNWKPAIKAIKKYLREHAGTDEEKTEATFLLRKAEGSLEFERIEIEYDRKKGIRRGVEKIEKLLEEYEDIPELVEKGEVFLAMLREQYVQVVEDFENFHAQRTDDDGTKWRGGVFLEKDRPLVKQGRFSGHWKSEQAGLAFWMEFPLQDWSEYDEFCLWIHSKRPKKGKVAHIRMRISAAGSGFFTHLFAIDWDGWKEVRIPMRGKNSFPREGKPDWATIDKVHMYHADIRGAPMDVVLDDIRVEKQVR